MTFFDKKEEVLEIVLTPYGKQKLASGKFKPVYYAFFDDDILYDGGRAGFSESDNGIETRIQETTPSLRTQTNFTDLEKKVKKQKSSHNVETINKDNTVLTITMGLETFYHLEILLLAYRGFLHGELRI